MTFEEFTSWFQSNRLEYWANENAKKDFSLPQYQYWTLEELFQEFNRRCVIHVSDSYSGVSVPKSLEMMLDIRFDPHHYPIFTDFLREISKARN
jgi:hypothetical protein